MDREFFYASASPGPMDYGASADLSESFIKLPDPEEIIFGMTGICSH